jgi:hypothetical protein
VTDVSTMEQVIGASQGGGMRVRYSSAS